MGMYENKVCIITGGGKATLKNGQPGAIGYGIAHCFAKEGANLVITGRNVKKLEDAKAELEEMYGIQVLPVQADIMQQLPKWLSIKLLKNLDGLTF